MEPGAVSLADRVEVKVRAVELGPEDVVIVSLPDHPPLDEILAARDRLRDLLHGRSTIVLAGGAELEVLKRSTLVSVMANAIGWALHSDDGREVVIRPDGVPQIDVTDEEKARIAAAAERAFDHLTAQLHLAAM